MQDRRCDPRIPLEDMFYLEISYENSDLSVLLLDISIYGARIGLPPQKELPPVGSEIVFKNTSILDSFLKNRTAKVMWGGGVQFGVRFPEKLDTSIEEIATILQSDVFY